MKIFPLDFSLSTDPLSLFFVFTIILISLPSAVFSIGYMKKEFPASRLPAAWLLLIGFILSMILTVMVRNCLSFLIAWEAMSLLSYFLVTFEGEHEQSVQAGTIYIVMTHAGTAFIMAGFLILAGYANSFGFTEIKAAAPLLPSTIKTVVFLCFLIGFGTKAGIVPLHVWLPYAHPQAPSHISSLMSGVMIKLGIYGILRFVINILGVDSLWWGELVLFLAGLSCLAGVIYALMEHDLKRLLAYHSVENIGIILLGVGAYMIFVKINLPILAVFSLMAGLYHLLNHAVFKSLLFLAAGSVVQSTKTRNIEKLGGLIRLMPWTTGLFLIGAMAISALPPLNGFVSEWLTLQAFFLGALQASTGLKILAGLSAGVLALTGGLAAACFVKAFGITFLAAPRSEAASGAGEASAVMVIPMVFLALVTVALGLASAVVIRLLTPIAEFTSGLGQTGASFSLNNLTIAPQAGSGIFMSNPLILAVLIFTGVAAVAAVFLLYGRRKTVPGTTWDCGYYKTGPRNEYTATGFSKSFRSVFSFFLRPSRKTEKVRQSVYRLKTYRYEVHTSRIFTDHVYKPLIRLIYRLARSFRRLQPGSIHLYLSYIFITIVILVLFMGRF